MVSGCNYMTPTLRVQQQQQQEAAADAEDNKLSLTALWEYVVRTQCLPENLDVAVLFATIHTRLKSPEWEVRQNALRVLTDCMPLLSDTIGDVDEHVGSVLPDIVSNLGHLAPAVRKGAVDALKTYLELSAQPNKILLDLVAEGIEFSQENKVSTNVVLGIIMCLPFVLNARLNDATITYVIHKLLDKIVKVVHQETVLRALLRIRELVGSVKFDRALASHPTYNSKADLELLCGVYDLHMFAAQVLPGRLQGYTLSKAEFISLSDSDEPMMLHVNAGDKVILETEIQLESGPAITMKIHEENPPPPANDNNRITTSGSRTFQILPELSLEEASVRRTPRRVRFGGEVVKLRTPDSDSAYDEEQDATISIIADGNGDQAPVIEIKYVENATKTITTRTTRSLIPVPAKHTQSAPASPTGNRSERDFRISKEYRSAQNLHKKFSPTWGKSRIPRRLPKDPEVKDSPQKESLKVPKTKTKKKLTRKQDVTSKKVAKPKAKTILSPIETRSNSREGRFSPIPLHNTIELFHNLTRSPSPRPEETPSPTRVEEVPEGKKEVEVQTSAIEDAKPEEKEPEKKEAQSQTPEIYDPDVSEECAFQIYTSSEGQLNDDEVEDAPEQPEESADERWNAGYLNEGIFEDLQNMDDIKARQRGLEELLRVIQTPTVLDGLRDRLPSLLYILFAAVHQTTLHSTADQALNIIFSNMKQEALMGRLQQICLSLAKLGSPSGIRLAIVLMRRMPPKLVVDQLLSDCIIGAKSSKVREGALQIVMTVARLYPSTDLNIPKSLHVVIRTLYDRKKKVRQAALETLAALAQISGNMAVLDVAQEVTADMESHERQQVLQVIRTRLSRKQLPTVHQASGVVQYSQPQGDPEIEWLAKGVSTSSSPSSPHSKAHLTQITDCIASADQKTGIPSSAQFRTRTLQRRESFTHPPDGNNNNNSSSRLVRRQSERFISGSAQESTGLFNGDEDAKLRRRFVENYSPRASTAEVAGSGKVNYWKNNARSQQLHLQKAMVDEGDSDWSMYREEPYEGQNGNRTQVWAIDPSAAFATANNSSDKLSSANGTLRQVYVVNNGNGGGGGIHQGTNTENHRRTPPPPSSSSSSRRRSFSPPQRMHSGSHESILTPSQERWKNGSHQYHQQQQQQPRTAQRRGVVQKSFSSEQITAGLDRFRKENTFSSGSSSSSSVRQGHTQQWLRSGIPVPIYDSKLKIRTRNKVNNTLKQKGPMTIPHYPSVKSPSPASTPEKHRSALNRQPFSSGSESSGYFTPPPQNITPDLSTPQQSPQPERFVRIETPRKLVDSDPESFDDEDVEEVDGHEVKMVDGEEEEEEEEEKPIMPNDEPQFRASSSLNSLHFVERTLSKNETTNSLEFAKASFDQINVDIATHSQRKNVNSAPALNDLSAFATQLPGACGDALDDTQVPEDLYNSVSPDKQRASPVKVIKSSIARRKSSRYTTTTTAAAPANKNESAGDRPFTKPREAFHDISAQLESPEWELTVKGLQGMMRLIRHHRDVVDAQMHAVCVLLAKHIRNLRSQVARNACYAAAELFRVARRPLEMELDELATPLLARTADTNKFLRSDANAALDEMCQHLSVPKLVSVITFRGCMHQNAVVRSASARLLCNIVQRLGAEKVFQLPRDTRDKLLLAGANSLLEGSLEARQHAKMFLGSLAEHSQFQRAMVEAVPSSVLRHIDKTLRNLIK